LHRAPVGGDQEGAQLDDRRGQARDIFQPQLAMAATGQDALDRLHPQARHPQQHFARRMVDVDREAGAMLQGPGELGIDVERQAATVPVGRGGDFGGGIAIEAHHPVRLVEPMFAH
jgi:hypothetical protein